MQAIALQVRQRKIQTSATPVNAALQSFDRHLQQVFYSCLHRQIQMERISHGNSTTNDQISTEAPRIIGARKTIYFLQFYKQ
ncbi:hypothetical protein FYM52_00480 [Comamonas sp. CAH-2]|nr:hypothetical protein [Comamonas sp. CAH-2]